MSLQAMFDEVEYEIQSMAWPTHNRATSVMPVVELLRDLRAEVDNRMSSIDDSRPGTPDDVITTAQSHFHELCERNDLSRELTDSLCAQLAAMRTQIHAGSAILPSPDDAACYNE